jgi:dipeptidyl aminopeptidase/acylaminoacyl peptidase
MKVFSSIAFVVTLLVAICHGQATAPPPLTPEQLIFPENTISDVSFSPDGSRIVMAVTEPNQGTRRATSHIWELQIGSRQLRQLTNTNKAESSPRWSPDGSKLAYVSNVEGSVQIYLLPVGGGEPVRLTDGKKPTGRFAWSPDGKQIAFVAIDRAPTAAADQHKDDDPVVMTTREEEEKVRPRLRRLMLIDVATKEARQLSAGEWDVSEIEWTPDGAHLIVTARDQAKLKAKNGIYALSLADLSMKLIAEPLGSGFQTRVSPDGHRLAFIASPNQKAINKDLFIQPLAGGPSQDLTATSIDRNITSFMWAGNETVLAIAETGFGRSFYRLQIDGKFERVNANQTNEIPGSFDSYKGQIAFASNGSASSSVELWLSDGKGAAAKVSSFNDRVSQLALVRAEFVHFKSFDGLQIEGALLKPSTYKPGMKAPLIVLAHGGPVGRWEADFHYWGRVGQLLASHGYAVLYPNVRGSTGYGQRFSDLSRGDLGGGDFKDLMAGVDYLIAQGIADPDRLGIGGWSYGGEMSAWAITQTQRFKAAVVGAPVINQLSELGTEEDPSGDIDFFGVPYEHLDLLQRISPITYIKNAKTPTLILHGTEDTDNPIGQSKELFAALKYYGVECEFAIYPREPHGFREEKHNVDRMQRILRWYDSHLK